MAMARKCEPSACNSSTIPAELCWLMWLTMTGGRWRGPRQWMWPAKVFASPRSIANDDGGRVMTLLELDVGVLHDLGPLDALGLQEGLQVVRGAAAHHAADGAVGIGD